MTVRIPYNALVLVGDGEKALFLRNKGDAQNPNLAVEEILQQRAAQAHEGAELTGEAGRRAIEAHPDWQRFDKEDFARETARALYAAAHANRFTQLVVVAPPKILGELRKEFHKEVADRVIAEIDKTLTNRDLGEIERVLVEA